MWLCATDLIGGDATPADASPTVWCSSDDKGGYTEIDPDVHQQLEDASSAKAERLEAQVGRWAYITNYVYIITTLRSG